MKSNNVLKIVLIIQIVILQWMGPFVRSGQSGETGESNWGREHEGYKLSLSIDKKGEGFMCPVYSILVLSNTTDRVLETVRTPIRHSYKVHLVDDKGASIPLTRYGQHKMQNIMNTKVQPMAIPPHKVFSDKILLNRWYDLSESGQYALEISRLIANADGEGWTHVTSNIVKFNMP